MPSVSSANITIKLQHLFSLLQKGEAKTVIKELDALLTRADNKAGNNADVMHLAAMAHKADGSLDKAISYFIESCRINKNQPQVHNNLGNTYKQNLNVVLAEKHYKIAISLNPQYIDALKNLGLLYLSEQKYAQAKLSFQQALSLSKNDVSALTSLGNIYKVEQDYQLAIKLYKQALSANPNYVNAWHNLGVAHRMNGEFLLALECFKKAQVIAPNLAELDFNEANTQFDMGNYQQAEHAYWRALRKAPDNCEVHETLNEFYWQTGKKSEFGKSFKLAIEHLPNNSLLRQAYAESLLSAGNQENAKIVVDEALKLEKTPDLLHLKGKLVASGGDIKAAISLIESSLLQHYKLSNALDLIELLIRNFDYEQALVQISYAEKIAPKNQLLIAYKSTCWRLTNDERYHWLIDYKKHIQTYDIPVPKGYSSRAMFLDELQGVLLAMHQTDHEPLKQTLRFGTQTPGRLFYKPIKQIVELKNAFEAVTHEYISALPEDNSHPLLSRKTSQVSFAGSWSVKLKPNGFHVNHVHPEGWLSSCFYIHVPNFSSYSQASEHAGSIKFGESSMNLSAREKISRIVKPKPGLVAIFPSYVWHGTFPFNGPSDAFRLTAPCDITPMGE
jgi:tetratricopeptide (TPR) repeat protein